MYLYEWLKFMVNVGKYTRHSSYMGMYNMFCIFLSRVTIIPKNNDTRCMFCYFMRTEREYMNYDLFDCFYCVPCNHRILELLS